MSDNKVLTEVNVCKWCEKSKSHLFEDTVCQECYRRLLCAGVIEQEIFKKQDYISHLPLPLYGDLVYLK